MNNIGNIFFTRPWAIRQDVLNIMTNVIQLHLAGEKLSSDEIEDRITAAKGSSRKISPDYEVFNGVAKIPIYGIISKRASMISNVSPGHGTSVEEVTTDFKAALKDDAVRSILLDIDSPGGSVDGITELSELIYNSRNKKPITAFANGQMSSAAYWVGSAAGKVYASVSAEVGSIGIYAVIKDETVADHMNGIKSVIVRAGKHKAAGHPSKQLTESDVLDIQKIVDSYYDLFTEAVQRNRKISVDDDAEIISGKVFIGEEAVENGLVDGIETIENLFGDPQESIVGRACIRAEHVPVAQPEKKAETKDESDAVARRAKFNQQRILDIQKAAFPGQDALVKMAIDDILSVEEASKLFYERASIEQQAGRDWDTKPEIREEFSSKESYIGYRRAVSKGRARAVRNKNL